MAPMQEARKGRRHKEEERGRKEKRREARGERRQREEKKEERGGGGRRKVIGRSRLLLWGVCAFLRNAGIVRVGEGQRILFMIPYLILNSRCKPDDNLVTVVVAHKIRRQKVTISDRNLNTIDDNNIYNYYLV